jgi:hypothetical protein
MRTTTDDDGQGWFGKDTLVEARRRLMENLDDGSRCPCCGQLAKRYKRTIYSSQVAQLISLYRLNRKHGWERYFHRTIVVRAANNNDLGFLRHWGLLELEPNVDPSKKDSGNFRITDLGRRFVEMKERVPKSCFQYNDNVEGFTEETVDCREALKERFDYGELMGWNE